MYIHRLQHLCTCATLVTRKQPRALARPAIFVTIQFTGCFFTLGLPLKVQSTKKLILARLGVSRTIYVAVESPNLGFPYFNFLGGCQLKKTPCSFTRSLGGSPGPDF